MATKLDSECKIGAGARCIIKRAMRREGESPDGWPASALATWARANPGLIAPGLIRAIDRAVSAWTIGNNSGDPVKLAEGDAECDNQRRTFEAVLSLFGLTASYPGLYPVLKDDTGQDYYWQDGATLHRALIAGTDRMGRRGA